MQSTTTSSDETGAYPRAPARLRVDARLLGSTRGSLPNRRTFARRRTSLPPASQAMRSDIVSRIGSVVAKPLPSGRTRWAIDFGRRYGRRCRVYSIPNPADPGGRPIPFEDRGTAERVLRSMREQMAEGRSLDQVLAKYRGGTAPEDLVRHHLARYLERWERLVTSGRRSESTLRDLQRWGKDDGHFAFWLDRSVHGITHGSVEDWHDWLAERGLSPKGAKNVSDTFKTLIRWLHRRGEVEAVSPFPAIPVPEHAPKVISQEQQAAVLAQIPWERRGLFLAAASEALRMGELRALDLADYQDGRLRIARATKQRRADAKIGSTKTGSAVWRDLWSPALIEWLQWRVAQAEEGEVALFPNPLARNPEKRWAPDAVEREWRRACRKVGIDVKFQEGTRHSTLTALGQRLPERVLRAFSRHRDGRSLDRYSKPRATPEEIAKAMAAPRRP